ncbi:MAG TPA: sugar transferase [Lachnospiraceae bacterium]|nr:sugar transferase [Lachnospiraceae bacterium]
MNRTNSGANTDTEQILLDILLLVCSFGIDKLIFGWNLNGKTLLSLVVLMAVFVLIYILSNKEEYLYNVTLFWYLDRIHRKITKSFLISTVATSAVMYCVIDVGKNERKFYFIFLIISYVLLCAKTFFYRSLSLKLHKKTIPRTVFVGKTGSFNKFSYFLDKTNIQMNVVGYVAMTGMEVATDERYIGCLRDLEELIRTYKIDQVYIIQKHGDELPFTQQYVDLCIDMGVTVRLVVDFYKRRRANSFVSTVGTYPIIAYHTVSLNTYEKVMKRTMDIVGGLVGVILTSPFMLVAAIAIKLDSKGPVLFKQTRVGQNGRHFKIYKFRSMYMDAEERKKELMAQNEVKGGVMFKMKDDPRVTKVGKFIRRTSIDEFPQFFNVVQGTMSLVGTRPPTLDEVEKYQRKQWRRISIKPGITGMWQVSGRSKVRDFDEIVELDTEYIDSWTLWLDIKIILKTVIVLFKHDDAY